jgi:polyhydroxyalkanoic acid synthase PhaR subunit
MGDKPKGNPSASDKPFDPLEAWRNMRDATLDAWSKAMIEAVNTEAYASATGAMLDASLSASAPFREALEKSMVQTLQMLNLPTRADFESLAERMTNLEMRLDDIDAKLDGLSGPSRTKAKPRKRKSKPR